MLGKSKLVRNLVPEKLVGVRQLAAARHGGVPVGKWSFTPADASEAYAMQEAFLGEAKYGHKIGYKIAGASKASRDILKVQEPFYGVLFQTLTAPTSQGTFEASKFFIRLVEAEIALVLGRDIDGRNGDITPDAVRAATKRVMPAIEVADSRFGDRWRTMGGLNMIVDNASHGRFVLGEGGVDPKDFDPSKVITRISVNGDLLSEGNGAKAGQDDSFEVAAWLANKLGARGVKLHKGEIISTGTATSPYVAKAGDKIDIEYCGLGKVSVSFR
jgi:2-keto-4-pentenoate hydratase